MELVMTLESVVIVAAKRTPMGGFMGALSDAQSTELISGEHIGAHH